MPRPIKWRRVSCLRKPIDTAADAARNDNGVVQMSVEEYETIRLIDTEGTRRKLARNI